MLNMKLGLKVAQPNSFVTCSAVKSLNKSFINKILNIISAHLKFAFGKKITYPSIKGFLFSKELIASVAFTAMFLCKQKEAIS